MRGCTLAPGLSRRSPVGARYGGHGDARWASIVRKPVDGVVEQMAYDRAADARKILEGWDLGRDRPVLELATGTGRTMAVLTRIGYQALTGDLTLDELSTAKARVGATHLESVRFLTAPCRAWSPLPPFTCSSGRLEFPGFSGHSVAVDCGPFRTGRGSGRRHGCDGASDCRTFRCSRPRRRLPALGSCRCAS